MTQNKIAIMAIITILLYGCIPTPTPGPTPWPTGTCNPGPTFWPTDITGPTEWVSCTPMPTARNVARWPTCTVFPTPVPLALAIQDACLLANGQPIILGRDGPIWRQARQMYEGCPLSPEIRVTYNGKTYRAQRFLFGYLFYEEGFPATCMWYMTHLGWEIHEAYPCVRYDMTPVWAGIEMPILMHK